MSRIAPCEKHVPGEIIVKRIAGIAETTVVSVRNNIGATVMRSIPELNLESKSFGNYSIGLAFSLHF